VTRDGPSMLRGAGPRFGAPIAAVASEVSALLVRGMAAIPRMPRGAFMGELHRTLVGGLPMVGTAALLAGMVMALSTAGQLGRLGLLGRVPDVTALFVTRELAPVFTGLLMAGRAGAGLAAELGLLSLSGQATAMRALGLDLDRELVAPRLAAVTLGTLLLTVAATLLGLVGGLLFGVEVLNLPAATFTSRLASALAPAHLLMGSVKGLCFGGVIAVCGLRRGLLEKADAAALGQDTMRAVVGASFSILVLDQALTTLLDAVTA
jgi:phospholipid/cholesterol/gamma-HCH transport system permease protein